MSAADLKTKLADKWRYYFSWRYNLRRLAFFLDSRSLRHFVDHYCERSEGGPTNVTTKLARQAAGGPFEPYSISLINKAAVQLVESPKKVYEAGCGTGMFVSFLAAKNSEVQITASEFDERTLNWAMINRAAPNIQFCKLGFDEFGSDEFDLAVALEVVEHVFDYVQFLRSLSRVAPVAIISTPNKNRNPFASIANTPAYSEHVREWTAGEFFWVLRCFYDDVQLYTLPKFKQQVRNYRFDSAYEPKIAKCGVLERQEPLIALCRSPRRS